jgi:hypothetical protein
MYVQGIYFNPECANIISITHLFALQSMKMQWGGGDDFSNLTEDYFSNLMEDGAGATTLDITVIEASPYLTIMDINELPLGIIQ